MTRLQLRQILIFFFSLLLLLFLADKIIYIVLNKLSDKVYAGYTVGKLNHYLAIKDTTDVLVFGSSRANRNVDTDLFPVRAFNIGLDGMLIAFYAPLIKMLPENKEQLVLLHLDGYPFFYRGEESRALMTKYHREPVIKDEIDRLGISSPLMKFFWTLDYNGVILGMFSNLLKQPYNWTDYSGFDPLILNEAQKKAAREILLGPNPYPCDDAPEPNEIVRQRIKEIKEFCDQNQKTLIVFTAPKYVEDCPEMHEALVNFLKKTGIEYYDFSGLFGENSPLDYWRDRTHLVKRTSEIFTRHMVDSIPALKRLQEP